MKKQSLLIAYHILSLLLFPFFGLFFLGAVLRRPAYRRGMAQRFGCYPSGFFRVLSGKKVIWIHAASVGEVMMSRSFVHTLQALYPDIAVVFSTITPSGQETARQHFKGIALHLYFPFDLLWIVRPIVRRMQPSLFIFLETEIWANCLKALSEQNVPSVMINGRISERSFPRYKKFRPFFSEALSLVSAFLMQSDQDAKRIRRIGAPPDRVVVTGNMKYDQAGSEAKMPSQKTITLEALGLNAEDRLMIAGSTRPGEEDAVLEAYQILQATLPSLKLLIAPRHLQRLDEVEPLLVERGFQPVRKTAIENTGRGKRVILLDTLGELEQIYGLGDFIFVGGGLAPFGGHNLLEVAALGKPVFFGPHMANFKEVAAQLKASGGGIEVVNGKDLGEKMVALAESPAEFRGRGEAALQVVLKHRGAVKRNLDCLSAWLDSPGKKKDPDHAVSRKSPPVKKKTAPVRPHSYLASAWKNSGGPASLFYFPLTLLSWIYALLCHLRFFLYALRLLPTKKAACPVVSIGNLTVGGTGKTPVTIYLAEYWQKKGLVVGIVSRGYHRNKKEAVVLVSDGRGPLESPAAIGDEPYLMAKRLKGIPIVVASDRHSGCERITSGFKLDLILLDDGFQHLRLHRDLNILLLDARRPFGNEALLPRGPLREPLKEIRRADLVIFTRVDPGSDLKSITARIEAEHKPVLFSHFEATSLTQASTGRAAPLSDLQGRSILPFCGIANPEAFFRQLTELGAEIKDALVFEDHHTYHEVDFRKIRQSAKACGAKWMVTTEKDAVKLEFLMPEIDDYWVLQIGLVPEGEMQFWEEHLFRPSLPRPEKSPSKR